MVFQVRERQGDEMGKEQAVPSSTGREEPTAGFISDAVCHFKRKQQRFQDATLGTFGGRKIAG